MTPRANFFFLGAVDGKSQWYPSWVRYATHLTHLAERLPCGLGVTADNRSKLLFKPSVTTGVKRCSLRQVKWSNEVFAVKEVDEIFHTRAGAPPAQWKVDALQPGGFARRQGFQDITLARRAGLDMEVS